jgi:hypothetical protein
MTEIWSSMTRKGLLKRSIGAVGGAWALAAFGATKTARADFIIDCNYISTTIQASTTCKVCWGNPSCIETRVGCYSKNGIFFIKCDYVCPGGCNGCEPPTCQARAGICNNGNCHCDNVCL